MQTEDRENPGIESIQERARAVSLCILVLLRIRNKEGHQSSCFLLNISNIIDVGNGFMMMMTTMIRMIKKMTTIMIIMMMIIGLFFSGSKRRNNVLKHI